MWSILLLGIDDLNLRVISIYIFFQPKELIIYIYIYIFGQLCLQFFY